MEDNTVIIDDEDIKPLVIDSPENAGVEKPSRKVLKVEIETLTLRPANPQPVQECKVRRQTAWRGKPFRPGQVARQTPIPTSTYNEWKAAKGLIGLSDAQPKSDDIRKLYDTQESSIEEIDVTPLKKPKLRVPKKKISVTPIVPEVASKPVKAVTLKAGVSAETEDKDFTVEKVTANEDISKKEQVWELINVGGAEEDTSTIICHQNYTRKCKGFL